MKNERGHDMPGITIANVNIICSTLSQLCNIDGPKVGGVTFIPDDDAEAGPGVKCLIMSGFCMVSFRMTTEQVNTCLETLQESLRTWKNSVEQRFEDFTGMGPGLCPPPEVPKPGHPYLPEVPDKENDG